MKLRKLSLEYQEGDSMNIEKKLIKYNFSSRNGKKIEYIVIHDTGNKNKGANADAHYNYFNGGNRNASAHYFVDDSKVLQLVKDSNSAWHCGDGQGKFGITNQNSIGIEICVNADGNYDKAVANAIELTRYLMKKYNIPLDRVVRHYDASRKLCPASMSANNWQKWLWFKEQLKEKQTKKAKVLATALNIRQSPSTSAKILGTYKKGDIVEILEEHQGWYKTPKGWISATYVTLWQQFGEQLEEKKKARVLATALNIRQQPSTSAKILGQYKKGDIVEVLEEKQGWYRTNKGWISSTYVTLV